MRDTPGRRYRWWRLRRRRDRGRPSRTLEARAVWALIPEDPAALGDFIAGLRIISGLLLHELHEATGQPPPATLQRLAILAETRPGTPSAG